jgi:molecular chaperone Hsp33
LYRLFHEENCRMLSETALKFACSCSRKRVTDTIQLLGKADANDLLDEKGIIEVICDFCNEHYQFDDVDVAQIFALSIVPNGSSNTTH